MSTLTLQLAIISGVDDGTIMKYSAVNGDGLQFDGNWTITIGRLDDSDVRLPNDGFISRHHANLHWRGAQWWLEDCDSRNGTFIDNPKNFFEDARVTGIIPLTYEQPFRAGRTWLCILSPHQSSQ